MRRSSIRRPMRAAVVVALGAAMLTPARAQTTPDPLGLEHGALLFHGNYCGPGNRAPLPPVDALDRACMHHDLCSPATGSGQLPRCWCNTRLRSEAFWIAHRPHQRDDLRALAEFVADGAALLPCE